MEFQYSLGADEGLTKSANARKNDGCVYEESLRRISESITGLEGYQSEAPKSLLQSIPRKSVDLILF